MSRSPSPPTASERTPLIARDDEDYSHANGKPESTPKKSNRLPSFIALSTLCIAVIVALAAGFAAPAVVEEYAKEALTFEQDSVSIESFTSHGVDARIRGGFYFDGDKVRKKSVRDLGRAATWFAHKVESGESEVDVYLPEYDNVLLGKASIPPVTLDIRDGHYNKIDILMTLEPGNITGIRAVAQDWIGEKLEKVNVDAIATVPVKSGIFSFGTKVVKQSLQFSRGGDGPKKPDLKIENLKVAEYGQPGHPNGVKAIADVAVQNPYPIKFDVPPITMEILLPDCFGDYLMLGTMKTNVIHMRPNETIHARGTAFMQELPTSLTTACPNTSKSPLDQLVSSYLSGKAAQVFVRGGKQDDRTPQWIGQILSGTVIPVPVPVHPIKNMIKNFTLSDVHFKLPEPTAAPGTPAARPMLTASTIVRINLPDGINVEVDVNRVRAYADVYYKGDKMGELDLREWQKSNSSKHGNELWVQSQVVDAPLDITNPEIFTKVVQGMIFGGKGVALTIKATVDVNTETALGTFTIRKIPAEGNIFIKPLSNGGFEHTVKGVEVVGSSKDELIMQANVQVINPTDYSASVPFVNVSLWHNGTRLGFGWGSFDIKPGPNDIAAKASWATGKVGRELLSQYISGYNTTLTIRSQNDSIPGLPTPEMEVTVPMPHMFGKFLKETTMHILSSTATFVLFSPIPMYVTTISATANYKGKEIGVITYEEPFEVTVGDTLTPRLPVSWNTDGGLGLIRDAIGGRLLLDARADVGVKIGDWEENIWFAAKGIGAKVEW